MIDSPATISTKAPSKKPSRLKLGYDIAMMVAITIDLLLIGMDTMLMSDFSQLIAAKLNLTDGLIWYQSLLHQPLRTAGGFFTVFLIAELLVRWGIAIYTKVYYRWFFFPFVHWYEVLGCSPQLRALRLFRVVIIGRRLYQLGYQVLPQPWIVRIKFYINLLLEELSDRVILTTIRNYRAQLTDPKIQQSIIQSAIGNNRDAIESALLSLLKQELTPKLLKLKAAQQQGLASDIGVAVESGLANAPELRRYLKMIPIAGGLIESQLLSVGHSIGENVVTALTDFLLDPERLEALFTILAHDIAMIDTDNAELEALIARLITASLDEFEAQIKVQQWKHQDLLNF